MMNKIDYCSFVYGLMKLYIWLISEAYLVLYIISNIKFHRLKN
jgi:hypothetical protein